MSRSERRQIDDIYAQILAKFIINLPKVQLSLDRIWFHYQNAYYYYLDNEKNKSSKIERGKKQQEQFYEKLIKLSPPSFKYNAKNIIDLIADSFDNIPVYGAILINQKKTKFLCIENKKKLGFPKGKIDEGETPVKCAVREVWEQIGYDISKKINENDFITIQGNGSKSTTFFIVKDIKQETFKTQVSTQVQNVVWVSIIDNPSLVKASRAAVKLLIQFLQKQTKVQKSYYEIFLQNFKLQMSKKNYDPPKQNPFTSFKLDTKKLLQLLKDK